jgi:hypothetical protein
MTVDEIISIIIIVTVVGIVLWDMNNRKKNEPRE